MKRTLYESVHEDFRSSVRRFVENKVAPNLSDWETAGIVDRSLFTEAGAAGLLGMSVPEEFGGGGVDDFRFNAVVIEELAYAGALAVTMNISGFNDLIAPYLVSLANEEQQRRWLPNLCEGTTVAAIAMTEPEAGSDLAGIATVAEPHPDHFVLNGSKTFISNGVLADILIVVCRTDPSAGRDGFSLLVVERGMEGFSRGRKLDKIGLSSQDTAELHFDSVRVPRTNLLGQLNEGFRYLKGNLPQERLSVAVASMAAMRRSFDTTVCHATTRKAFGSSLSHLQHVRFELAEMRTEIEVTQAFVDNAISAQSRGTLTDVDAAMAKWWATELHQRVVTRCLQLHGGYGFIKEYSIARDFLDARGATIYAGATEIMKEIIGRDTTRGMKQRSRI